MNHLKSYRTALVALAILGATAVALAEKNQEAVFSNSFIPMDAEQAYLTTSIEEVTYSRVVATNPSNVPTGPSKQALVSYAQSKFSGDGFPNRCALMVAITKDMGAKLTLSSSFIRYGNNSYLGYFHSYEYWPDYVKVKIGGTDYDAIAYWGHGCRLQFLMKTIDAEAGIGMGSFGLEAHFKQTMESANFKAMGYEAFVPFELKAGEDGKVDFVEGRRDLLNCFNEYQKSAGGKGTVLLGFELSVGAIKALNVK